MMISFVIPSYNEKESLPELVSQITSVANKNSWNFEIIIVDDGSTDSTFETLKSLKQDMQNLHAIRFRRNSGKAMALSAGFEKAQGEFVVMMDADLQDDPNDVPRLLQKMSDGYDVVTGWKAERHDPWHKVIPSRVINAIVRAMYGLVIHDMNCGLKIFKREVIKEVPVYGELYRYILLFAHARGFKVGELKTTHHARAHGVSKFGVSRIFKGLADLFTVYFLTKYSKRPLHFFGIAGFLLSFAGLIILLYLTVLKMGGETIGDRPLLLFGVLLLLIGIQLFATGFVAELLASERPEQRPPIEKEL